MKVTILQPTYWARTHVWNRILMSDVFVWLDSVKFSRSATKWEDRTIIEAPDGRPIVLRLPLRGSRLASWSDAGLNDGWRKHLTTITQCYSKRPHWPEICDLIGAVYREEAETIDEVCWRSFTAVASALKPHCRVVRSSSLPVRASKGELVLETVQAVRGTSYICGAPGTTYLPLHDFAAAGIEVRVQTWQAPPARHGLANPSVIDLLANVGSGEARAILSDESAGSAQAVLPDCEAHTHSEMITSTHGHQRR